MAKATAQRRGQRARKRKRTSTAEPAACGVTLPDDLVTEVLLRVPARSLARIRSTCRSWNAEISSRRFQERHRALAATKLAFLRYARPHNSTLHSMPTSSGRPGTQWSVKCRPCPRVIGSAKDLGGLVLVSRSCAGYFVCSPTTGEALRLPRSHQIHCAMGLGFHAASREFKVVQIINGSQLQAMVLTVGDSRGWRAAPAAAGAGRGNNQAASPSLVVSFTGGSGNAEIIIDKHVQPVLADGCLHWSFGFWRTAEDFGKPHGHGIISFSLAQESFRLVPHPPFTTADEDEDEDSSRQLGMPVGKTLAELDGRLCRMRDLRRRSDVGSLLFEIWKLHDYDTGSWSLDYRVDLTSAAGHHMAERLKAPWLVVPLSYIDDGGASSPPPPPPAEKRKLLLATTAQEAHIYDPGSGTLRTVVAATADSRAEDDQDVVRLLLYQESLVRFPGMKKGKGRIAFLQIEQMKID